MNNETLRPEIQHLSKALADFQKEIINRFVESHSIKQAEEAKYIKGIFSGQIDIDNSICLDDRKIINDMIAIFFFVDSLKSLNEDKRVRNSALVQEMIDSMIDGIENAVFSCSSNWQEFMSNAMKKLVDWNEKRRQSVNGRRSKRGPANNCGMALVREVYKLTNSKIWTSGWNLLVQKAIDNKNIEMFALTSHSNDVIRYKINDREKIIKKSSFETYWSKIKAKEENKETGSEAGQMPACTPRS